MSRFSVVFFCLTVTKDNVEETFYFSDGFGYRKIFMIKTKMSQFVFS